MSASGSPAIVAAPPSRSPQRKSPPPPPLNLDELKTRFASVPAYHAPPAVATPGNGATSFVFTSSRTKQLQQPLGPPFASTSTSTNYGARPASPNRLRRSGSPVSPAASTSTASTVRNHQYTKPALSPSQLARHGEGAMDSRRILGPNMRAAGFVHLSNSVKSNSGSAATSPASSPGWQEMPGPSNYMGTTTVQVRAIRALSTRRSAYFMRLYSSHLPTHHPSRPSCSYPRLLFNMSVCGTTNDGRQLAHPPLPPRPSPRTFTHTPRMAPIPTKGAA